MKLTTISQHSVLHLKPVLKIHRVSPRWLPVFPLLFLNIMSDAVTANVTVPGPNGLHLVPCSLIAQRAAEFACQITIRKGETSADARNIFELLGLGAAGGTVLNCEASGDDAPSAIESLVALFESGFQGHADRKSSEG
jgi:phosphotransferase system HPr (HPr) family protein